MGDWGGSELWANLENDKRPQKEAQSFAAKSSIRRGLKYGGNSGEGAGWFACVGGRNLVAMG